MANHTTGAISGSKPTGNACTAANKTCLFEEFKSSSFHLALTWLTVYRRRHAQSRTPGRRQHWRSVLTVRRHASQLQLPDTNQDGNGIVWSAIILPPSTVLALRGKAYWTPRDREHWLDRPTYSLFEAVEQTTTYVTLRSCLLISRLHPEKTDCTSQKSRYSPKQYRAPPRVDNGRTRRSRRADMASPF